ncbi:MAG: type II secretion system protein [Chthoniobacterales bacterium]
MWSASRAKKGLSARGFTLIEVLMVVVILAILMVLFFPHYERMTQRAQSVVCMNNLRHIGVMVTHYLNDNDQQYPKVETNPVDPVYTGETVPGMVDTFSKYGMDSSMLRCPVDMGNNRRFTLWGSSYEWKPIIDEERQANPLIYTRRGARSINPRRLRLVIDFDPLHFGRQNTLYADGHVVAIVNP